MGAVSLRGSLICADRADVSIVERLLSEHIALSHSEPGCLHFEVTQSDDPLVWTVVEDFADRASFDAHQERVKSSEWGRGTVHIERAYALADDGEL